MSTNTDSGNIGGNIGGGVGTIHGGRGNDSRSYADGIDTGWGGGSSGGGNMSGNTVSAQEEIGRAHVELQSRGHLVCRLLLEKKNWDLRAYHVAHAPARAMHSQSGCC